MKPKGSRLHKWPLKLCLWLFLYFVAMSRALVAHEERRRHVTATDSPPSGLARRPGPAPRGCDSLLSGARSACPDPERRSGRGRRGRIPGASKPAPFGRPIEKHTTSTGHAPPGPRNFPRCVYMPVRDDPAAGPGPGRGGRFEFRASPRTASASLRGGSDGAPCARAHMAWCCWHVA